MPLRLRESNLVFMRGKSGSEDREKKKKKRGGGKRVENHPSGGGKKRKGRERGGALATMRPLVLGERTRP